MKTFTTAAIMAMLQIPSILAAPVHQPSHFIIYVHGRPQEISAPMVWASPNATVTRTFEATVPTMIAKARSVTEERAGLPPKTTEEEVPTGHLAKRFQPGFPSWERGLDFEMYPPQRWEPAGQSCDEFCEADGGHE